jgi:hypothetical protein
MFSARLKDKIKRNINIKSAQTVLHRAGWFLATAI